VTGVQTCALPISKFEFRNISNLLAQNFHVAIDSRHCGYMHSKNMNV
jgi:hypothetical protein